MEGIREEGETLMWRGQRDTREKERKGGSDAWMEGESDRGHMMRTQKYKGEGMGSC